MEGQAGKGAGSVRWSTRGRVGGTSRASRNGSITGRFAARGVDTVTPEPSLDPIPRGVGGLLRWVALGVHARRDSPQYDHVMPVSDFGELYEAMEQRRRALSRPQQFAKGLITTDDLDDEELARQQVREDDGTFARTRPAMSTDKIADMQRALLARGNDVFKRAFLVAAETMLEIASDPNVPPQTRLAASKMIVDKVAPTATVIEIKPHDPVIDFFTGIAEPGAIETIDGTVVPEVPELTQGGD